MVEATASTDTTNTQEVSTAAPIQTAPAQDSASAGTVGQEQVELQESKPEGLSWIQKVNELQQIPERIRNICILAHVDHGKTTLSDCLISSNNIISQKLAGTLRYLDSREDEQQRQITMKASSISILYGHKEPPTKKEPAPVEKQHLLNLIDSPGHVDFSIEVSSAVSLSDGALILIDCVEGVSPQTTTVIRQAFEAKVKTCLVLNKLDRLIIDKWMDAQEIYNQVSQIIEQANSYLSELIQGDYIRRQEENENKNRARSLSSNNSSGSEKMTDAEIDAAEHEYLYSPEKGNVAFASALDNWGFTLDSLCPRIAKSFGMNPKALKQFMWGKYYYISDKKKIVKTPPREDSKEMFVQFAMQPLVAEYRKVFNDEMVGNTNLLKEAHKTVKARMLKIVPINKAILSMIVKMLPSPLEGQKRKIDSLAVDFRSKVKAFLPARKAIMSCNQEEPIIVYVTKMQPFQARLYNVATRSTGDQSSSNLSLIAVARVYSGTLRVGSRVFVFGANHSPETPDMIECDIPHLFLLMGQQLQPISQVGPGCIVGIGGLENILLKTGTISNTLECPNFSKLHGLSNGLIKVTIEPKLLMQSAELLTGLTQMARADPSVEFFTTKKGENILSTCGEVHLEKCLKDLETDYAPGIEFEIGEPIIPFKETIINKTTRDKQRKVQKVYEELNSSSESSDSDEEVDVEEGKESLNMIEFLEKEEEHKRAREMVRQDQQVDPYLEKLFVHKLYRDDQASLDKLGYKLNCAEDMTANQKVKIKVRAVGLNYMQITKWLEAQEQKEVMWKISRVVQHSSEQDCSIEQQDIHDIRRFLSELKRRLIEAKTDKALIRMIFEQLQAFGPNAKGSNFLLNKYMTKEESLIYRLEHSLDLQQKRNLEENKSLPQGVINLAPSTSEAEPASDPKAKKRMEDIEQRVARLGEIMKMYSVTRSEIFNSFMNGFIQASQAGPLCEEPMQGACFIIQNIELVKEEELKEEQKQEESEAIQAQAAAATSPQAPVADSFGSLSGQIISIVKELCRLSFLNAKPRLAEGMYLCKLVATPENYGIVYNLLNKCRGKVISEECQDGTNYFLLDLMIPLVTSFEFHKSVRLQCQGLTYPQLVFNGFMINEEDPFFIPTTEEELEELGVGDILPENPAKVLIENVRVRKGLLIDKKIVMDADKQRTHKRNK